MKIKINRTQLNNIVAESIRKILGEGAWDASDWSFPQSQNKTHNDTVEEFINAYSNGDYNKCKSMLDYIDAYRLWKSVEYELGEKWIEIYNNIMQK